MASRALIGVTACALFLAAPAPLRAQEDLLDYSTFAGYGLGKGILGNDFSHPLPSCVTGTTSPLPASHASLRASITYSAYEYKQAFHFDQKAEATFLDIGGGSESAQFGQETGTSGSAFDIIVEAYSEHDGQTLGSLKWDAPYDAMIASGDPGKIQSVRNTCGDRFIQTVFNEARLFAVLRVSAQRTSSLTQFSGKASGKIGIDIVSASASLGGDASISSANQTGAIAIEVRSEGLGGIAPTAGVIGIATSDGLTQIATKLAAYLGSLHATGQPVKYQLTPLPGIPIGNLSDARIFDYLRDLKSGYLGGMARLQNVNALLGPGDFRRTVFNQPQADTDLRAQKALLQNFVDAVSMVHDDCRKAVRLQVCSEGAGKLPQPPLRARVELPPLFPPYITMYGFAINGIMIAPFQNVLLFSAPGTTVFAAAKALNPAAQSVDILAQIRSAYVSHVDIMSMAPQPSHPWVVVAAGRLLPQHLAPPPYFPADFEGVMMRVLHADAQQPCSIANIAGLNTIDSGCLTPAGRLMRDVALADVANYLAAAAPNTTQHYHVPYHAVVQDCFAPASPAVVSNWLDIDVSPGAGGAITSRAVLFLTMPGVMLPVINEFETHDAATWQALKQSRIAALIQGGGNLATSSPCSPHIP